ncbi:hypothetical protein [Cohnella abietis]|uniref:hypothetical protein n=1 Tax=Cohnella abietis TaxID=2507935 RepID=UPI00102E7882|nr:hypothetical protein [Cohnella abietis]
MKKIMILLSLIVVLVLTGCSKGNNAPDSIAEGSSPIETEEADPTAAAPQYIAEGNYEGDELGIVKTLNLYVKAFYERDHEAFYKTLSKDNYREIDSFKKYFVSMDKLDFSVKPHPTPPEGIKSVVVDYKQKLDDRKDITNEQQIFYFIFEDGSWKLNAIADYWT